jgi:hypothetical protein
MTQSRQQRKKHPPKTVTPENGAADGTNTKSHFSDPGKTCDREEFGGI